VGAVNVPVMRSDDLAHWVSLGDALPRLPGWAAAGRSLTWAPAVVQREGRFVLFYTARHAALGLQCVTRAVADSPAGPFVDWSTEPFICQRDLGGSIDPSPFVDADGTLYLYWKNDGNCCGRPVGLWGQRLSADGSTLIGAPVQLLARDQTWEGPLIEGPDMWRDGSRYYLFYSANWYLSDRYAVGYGVCGSPLGPCSKPLAGPILASSAAAAGPGGQTIFTDARGVTWLAYHAWTSPRIGYDAGGVRSLRIDRVRFVDGAPVIDGPTTTPQPVE
jgi:beta-xylosidase